MKDRNKTLVVNMVFFGLVTFVTKGVAYLLLPIFTTYLSTTDYGTVDLLISTVNMLYPLSALGMGAAILRFTITEDDRKVIFTSALRIIVLTALLTLLFVPLIIKIIGNSRYVWFVPLEMFFTNLIAIMVSLCKGIGKSRLFLIQSMVKASVLLVSAFATLKYLKMGIGGYIISYLLADGISIFCFAVVIHIHRYIVLHLDKETWRKNCKKLVKYGAPLVPNSMSAWVIQMSDRYMVAYWYGASLNGLYAVAYKIPSIIKMFTSVFINAWQLNVISEEEKQDSKEYFDNMKRIYSAVCFIVATLIMLFLKLIAKILFAKEFYEAWKFVPLLVVAMVVDLLAEYLGTYFYAKDRTGYLFVSTLIGAVINVGLNFCLIPSWGAWGATVATVISAIVIYVHRGWSIGRTMGLKTITAREVLGIGILVVICISYLVFEEYVLVIAIIAFAIILMIFSPEMARIYSLIQQIVNRFKN